MPDSVRRLAQTNARASLLEPLVREGVTESLIELGECLVISHPAVSTMLIGYSTLRHLEEAIAAPETGLWARPTCAPVHPLGETPK
ncbi:MAG: hypothetical protein Q8K93_25745 [Reyranella sp.]|uniref:hypothetical protein n=1 Tax=Reyranella sp. TaxID=1929291 RepID=UPI002731DD9B|nr:hypothetical protein [Reyranella sp.]MDP1965599.1 hypothetical protein [Reyranella sp.]MDP2373297.1 hypothetical protein [Reyranella sp.]